MNRSPRLWPFKGISAPKPLKRRERPLRVCAVTRRRFPVGASPTRRFAPAGSNRSSHGGNEMAEPFDERLTNWGQRECAGRNASERHASLEKDDVQADPATLPGKADTAGLDERGIRPAAAPG